MLRTASSSIARRSGSPIDRKATEAYKAIAAKGLLISWATPAANVPTEPSLRAPQTPPIPVKIAAPRRRGIFVEAVKLGRGVFSPPLLVSGRLLPGFALQGLAKFEAAEGVSRGGSQIFQGNDPCGREASRPPVVALEQSDNFSSCPKRNQRKRAISRAEAGGSRQIRAADGRRIRGHILRGVCPIAAVFGKTRHCAVGMTAKHSAAEAIPRGIAAIVADRRLGRVPPTERTLAGDEARREAVPRNDGEIHLPVAGERRRPRRLRPR